MSRPYPNTYLGSYHPSNQQNNGAPAHIIRHAQQMLSGAGGRPPPNIVAHAEQMIAEHAMRRQVASSQPPPPPPPPPPPYHLVASAPQVLRPMVVQQHIVYQHHPIVRYPIVAMPLCYPRPPQVYWHARQQNIDPYPYIFAQPHCGQNLTVPSIQQPMQTSRVLTHQTGTSLIEQLWGEEASTSNTTASPNTTPTTTQATITPQQSPSTDTGTANEGQSSATSPGQQPSDNPSRDPDNDLLTAFQTSLTTLDQTHILHLTTAIHDSLRSETERLEGQTRRHEIASEIRLLEVPEGQ